MHKLLLPFIFFPVVSQADAVDLFDFQDRLFESSETGMPVWEGSTEVSSCPVQPYTEFDVEGRLVTFRNPSGDMLTIKLLDDGYHLYAFNRKVVQRFERYYFMPEQSTPTHFCI